jgi:Crossover junction endodeoxyribonuclease RuvC
MVRLLGIDPGLRFTGWGLIDVDGNRLKHVADGVIATDNTISVPARLKILHDGLMALLTLHRPAEAAVEETYVNRNGAATLKLGAGRRSGYRIRRQDGEAGGRRHRGCGEGAGHHDGAPLAARCHDPPRRRVRCAGGCDLPCASPIVAVGLVRRESGGRVLGRAPTPAPRPAIPARGCRTPACWRCDQDCRFPAL